ncbi:metallophosphoesterase family protein [Actinomycetospora sp. C-140]
MMLAQISDTHLSAPRPDDDPHGRPARARTQWVLVRDALRADPPDLVVHTGDMVLDDPDRTEDHAAARRAIGELPVPVLLVPGNHDLGDHASITDERRVAYLRVWGVDRWVHRHAGWRLVGINSLLLGSGLSAEREQEDWLDDLLASGPAEPTLLFCHQPLLLPVVGEAERWAVPPSGPRERLVRRLAGAGVSVVAGGHVHRHRDDTTDGVRQITAPSVAFAVPELPSPPGDPDTGYLTYRLADGPRLTVERRVLRPSSA